MKNALATLIEGLFLPVIVLGVLWAFACGAFEYGEDLAEGAAEWLNDE